MRAFCLEQYVGILHRGVPEARADDIALSDGKAAGRPQGRVSLAEGGVQRDPAAGAAGSEGSLRALFQPQAQRTLSALQAQGWPAVHPANESGLSLSGGRDHPCQDKSPLAGALEPPAALSAIEHHAVR